MIVALAIPLSMLFASNFMMLAAISASLMSLGAIDFGLIVDSSVIMIENCMRRLSERSQALPVGQFLSPAERMTVIKDAAIEVRKPTMFGELIIAVVYLPILFLEGTEGKLFRPMALTVLFALGGSLILSLTLMPVLAYLGLPRRMQEKDVLLVRMIKLVYRPDGGCCRPRTGGNVGNCHGDPGDEHSAWPTPRGRVHASFGRR